MRQFILLILLTVFTFPQFSYSQNRIGDWQTFTNMMSVTDIEVFGDTVYATTTGGLLIFNAASGQFTKVTNVDGLSHTDLKSLIVDNNEMLWLAAGTPVGDINIWDKSAGIRKIIPLDQSTSVGINHLVKYGTQVFGAAIRNIESIVVHYSQLSSGEYEYKDFYNQFPVSIGAIQDLAIFRDRIYLATDVGLIRSKDVVSNTPNLKASSAWEQVSPESNYIAMAVTENTLNIANEQTVWQYDGNTLEEIPLSLSTSSLLELESVGGQLYLGARYGLFTYNGTHWSKVISQYIPVTAIARGENDNLWVGTLGFGLAKVDQEADSFRFYQPNCPFDNEYSAMVHTPDGRLVAANAAGISIYQNGDWSNFLNYGKLPNKSFSERLISDETSGDYWSADTMNYRSARPFDVVVRDDNQAFISHEGAGLLRVNLNDMTDYQTYDTTNGHLSGSEGIGAGAPNYVITRDITPDQHGTVWIANAFAANGNALTAYTKDGQWVHFNVMDPKIQGKLNLLPIEIAVDNQNRIWVSSQKKELDPQTNGGIAVLDYSGTLADQSDDKWIWLNNLTNGLAGMTVYSISITSDNVCYVVTDGEKRVQKYRIPVQLPENPADIFFRTDRIDDYIGVFPLVESESDVRNNIWFISANNGIKMRTARGELLNDAQGYNTDNSLLLSDNVYAIESAPEEGITYFSTDFGISAVTTQYAEPRKDYSDIYTFPSPFYIPNTDKMVIAELPDESEVKILTVTGQVVRTLTPNDGTVKNRQAFWNGRDESGDLVGSGVYFVYCYTQNGKVKTTKALVIRQ